jgi:hypothetical protein
MESEKVTARKSPLIALFGYHSSLMTFFRSLFAIGFLAFFASTGWAQNTGDAKAFAGKVLAISDSSITIRSKGVSKTLAIDANTPVTDATGIADIKVGQIVAVRTDESGAKAVLIRAKWDNETAGLAKPTPQAPAEEN